MPLHLPASRLTTRRQVLKTLAVGGGGAILAAWGGGVRAAASNNAPERWALLSDIHIDANPATVAREVCMAENLRKVVQEVVVEADSLEGVIIDGDCAYLKGLREDYDTVAGLLEPLRKAGLSVHLTMGNHDERGTFSEALSAYRPANPPVDGREISVIESRHANWLVLDSLRQVGRVEGEFGEVQRAWLAAYLEKHAEKPVLLMAHHYPQPGGGQPGPDGKPVKINGLVDTEAFLALVDRFPQVKAYIYGHSHNWAISTPEGGAHWVNLPPVAYIFKAGRPNGWVRATVDSAGMTLELRALDHTHPDHGAKTELKWR